MNESHTQNPLCTYLYDKIIDTIPKFEGNYLEIGVFNGSGISNIATIFSDKLIYAIDPFIEDGNTSWITGISQGQHIQLVKEAYKENTKHNNNITLFETTTEKFSNSISDKYLAQLNISGILIDGDHHTNSVIIDYDFAMKCINNKKGFIIFDDMHNSEVVTAYNIFKEKYKSRIFKEDPYHISGMFVEIKEI